MPETQGPQQSFERFQFPELCSAGAITIVVISAQMLALVLVLLSTAPTWGTLAVTSLFVQWVALVSAGALCWSRSWLAPLSPAYGALCAWLLLTGVIFSFSMLAEFTVSGRFGAALGRLIDAEFLAPGRPSDWSMILRTSLAGSILAGMLLRYLMVQQQLRSREQSELRLRLQALQSRIRPHFLFNSMNIIASLIETDPRTAEQVVEDLSELFRASLNEAGNQVSLQEELDLCERYVRIEKLRLGKRLDVRWVTDTIPHGVRIPLLTIQPLLENAIYHGIQPLPEGGTITVDVRLDGDRVEIGITNPVPQETSTLRQAQGNRMALANIRSRLEVLHGDAADLVSGMENERFRIRLSYPLGDDV